MKKFLQKISCTLGRHKLASDADEGVNRDGLTVILITIYCPACDKALFRIGISEMDRPNSFTHHGEYLH